MSDYTVYTVEGTEDNVWYIIDYNRALEEEWWGYCSGQRVLDFPDKEAAEFYCKLMNLVYNRVISDIKYDLGKGIRFG